MRYIGLLFCFVLFTIFLSGCRSSTDLLSDGQAIPFLSEADPETIELVDNADPFHEIGQRIIWKLHKDQDVTIESIIENGRNQLFGGLIMNGYTLEEFMTVRLALDSLVTYPVIFGTEEPMLLNNQFSGNCKPLPTLMMSSIKEDEYRRNIQDFLYDQMAVFGINFAGNIHVSDYRSNGSDWQNYYDYSYKKIQKHKSNIAQLNKRKTLSSYNYFDEEIISDYDSLLQVEADYSNLSELIDAGLSSIIIDPIVIQNYGTETSRFFSDILKFNGLLITKLNSISSVQDAIQAGIDMFIVEDPKLKDYISEISHVLDNRIISNDIIYESHRKLLLAKQWMTSNVPLGLTDYNLWLNIPEEQDLDEFSTTLVNNHKNLLPLTHTYNRDIRLLSYGSETLDTMESIMRLFADHKRNFYNSSFQENLPTISLSRYRFATIIVTLDSIHLSPKKDSAFITFINDMSQTRKVALINFGNPENLIPFDTTVTKLQIYRRNAHTEVLAAHILYGGAVAQGILPVTLSPNLVKGAHAEVPNTRWRYVNSSASEIDADEIAKIGKIAREGIRRKAFPGCQIFVAKDGKVIYNEAFGKTDYKNGQKLNKENIYDLASVTKVASTTLSAMRLVEKGWIGLKDPLSKFFTLHDTLDLSKVKIEELLTHRSGIQAYMPTKFIIENEQPKGTDCSHFRCDSLTNVYSLKTADKVYYSAATKDSLWNHVKALSTNRGKYKYSDVNFYLLQQVIEKITERNLKVYVEQEFYKPLGLRTCTFQPLSRFSKNRIVPTEQDKKWRSQILQGYVHDPTAALMGGVCGNAGLFSNAHDMAVIGQMLLNKGTYGGKRYFKEETVDLFTKAKFSTNRGLGFDSNKSGTAKVGRKASRSTYGHLGFTGTCIWVDPKVNLVYVFLSNRIHPNQRNNKISKYRYRQRIHDVIYTAMEKGKIESEPELEIRAAKASLAQPDQ